MGAHGENPRVTTQLVRPTTPEVLTALRSIAADMRRSTDVLEALLEHLDRESASDGGQPTGT